jgi:hypothetical protein
LGIPTLCKIVSRSFVYKYNYFSSLFINLFLLQQLKADIVFDNVNVDFIPYGEEFQVIGQPRNGKIMGWGASFVCILNKYKLKLK